MKDALIDTQCKCGLIGPLQVAIEVDGVLPLIHGTMCCPFGLRVGFSQACAKEPIILSTGMTDEDVIYGGRERLKEGILKVDKLYKPGVIIVVSSCLSDTIGDDIRDVAKMMQSQVKAKLLVIESGGYKLTEARAFDRTLSLFTSLMKPQKKALRGKSVNLVGFLGASLYGRSNLHELKRLFSLCNVRINCALAAESSLKKIQHASNADLNIVTSEARGLETAKKMQKEFGIPYTVSEVPVGFDTTYQWLLTITEKLGLNKKKEILKEKRKAEKTLLVDSRRWLTWYGGTFSNLSTAVFGEFDYLYPLIQFLHEELGMKLTIVGLDNATEKEQSRLRERLKSYGYQQDILLDVNMSLLERIYNQNPVDIIFGSSLHAIAAQRAYGRSIASTKVSYPIFGEMKILDIPIVGFIGALALCEKALNQISSNLPLMNRDIRFAMQFM